MIVVNSTYVDTLTIQFSDQEYMAQSQGMTGTTALPRDRPPWCPTNLREPFQAAFKFVADLLSMSESSRRFFELLQGNTGHATGL